MRGKIVHESRGRLRLRLAQKSLSLRQADLLEAWVKSQPWAVKAVARERNRCSIPRYTGEGAVALHALARFHCQTAAEAVSRTARSLPRSHGGLFVCKNSLTKAGKPAILGM